MRDAEDRKTKMIIEYAKLGAALAKDMEITFSKDSELFKVFPEAFKGAEGGEIQIKDAPTFYALQDKIMNYNDGINYEEGGDVDAEREAAREEIKAYAGTQSPFYPEVKVEEEPIKKALEAAGEAMAEEIATGELKDEVPLPTPPKPKELAPAEMYAKYLADEEAAYRAKEPVAEVPPPAPQELQDDHQNRVVELIDKYEGINNTLYLDIDENPTLGIGHLVNKDSVKILKDLGVPQEVLTKLEEGLLDIKNTKEVDIGLSDEHRDALRDYHISEKREVVRKQIPNFDNLPAELQAQLIQSAYRGGITGSGDTIDFINAGKWEEAAEEFLKHDEYLGFIDKGETNSITERMEALAAELRKMSGL